MEVDDLGPQLTRLQKIEYLKDVETFGSGIFTETFKSFKSNYIEKHGVKHLYSDANICRRLTLYRNQQIQKAAKNYIKLLEDHSIPPHPSTIAVQRQEECGGAYRQPKKRKKKKKKKRRTKGKRRVKVAGSDEVIKEEEEEEEETSDDSSGDDSSPRQKGKRSRKQPTTSTSKKRRAKPDTDIVMKDAMEDISQELSTITLSTHQQSTAGSGSSILLAATEGSSETPTTFHRGSRQKPILVEIEYLSELPFANGMFYVSRDEVASPNGVVTMCNVTLTVPPPDHSQWRLYSPPDIESLASHNLEFRDYGARSLLLQGTRMCNFLLDDMRDRMSKTSLSIGDQRLLEKLSDDDHPEVRSCFWLFTFPREVIFNNSTSQSEIEPTLSKLTLDGKTYGLTKDIFTAKLVWSVEEYRKTKASKSSSTSTALTKAGF